jgi:DNA-binding GntR family transcriptional regulator
MTSDATRAPAMQAPDPVRSKPAKSLRQYLEEVPKHGSTTDAVTDALREAILDGSLPPSSWLREDELAHDLRVSRTPVREALRRLGDEHLTIRAAHRGSMVAPMSLDDVLAVYSVREALESLAARMTAARQPPGIVDTLLDVHTRMTSAVESGDFPLARQLNFEFYRVIRDGTGNPYLQRFLLQVEHAIRRFSSSTLDSPARAAEVLAEHKGIIEAVAAGDPELAAKRASELVRRAREVRIQRMSGGV